MKKIKLVVVGCAGRMGQQIIEEIQKYKNINLIAAIEKKNSPSINKNIKKIKITSDKEIAFKKGWIGKEELRSQAKLMENTNYGQYLSDLLKLS